jgi:hypothetical protein
VNAWPQLAYPPFPVEDLVPFSGTRACKPVRTSCHEESKLRKLARRRIARSGVENRAKVGDCLLTCDLVLLKSIKDEAHTSQRLQHSIAMLVTKVACTSETHRPTPTPQAADSEQNRRPRSQAEGRSARQRSGHRHRRAEPQPIPLRLVCCCAAGQGVGARAARRERARH